MKTILAPIDFSPATKDVIAAASALARTFDGRVVLLNVTQPPVIIADESAYLMIDWDDLTEKTARAAVIQLEQLRDKLESDFINADIVQVTGQPVTQILEQARKLRADYIIMGSHGHTAFYDLLVGSTTGGVMKRATCPVVVVPRPAKPAKAPPASRRFHFERSDVMANR